MKNLKRPAVPEWMAKQSVSNPADLRHFLEEWPGQGFLAAIRSRMLSEGISVRELAHRMQLPAERVHSLLNYTHNLTFFTMIRIAAALGCGIEIKLKAFRSSSRERRKPELGARTRRAHLRAVR